MNCQRMFYLIAILVVMIETTHSQYGMGYGYGSMCRPYGGMYGMRRGWGMGMSGYGLYMKSYKKRGESTQDADDGYDHHSMMLMTAMIIIV